MEWLLYVYDMYYYTVIITTNIFYYDSFNHIYVYNQSGSHFEEQEL